MMTDKSRTFEMTIDVDASQEDVWRALTEARELTRWFPLEARVTPGKGGSMYLSWGDAFAGESRISEWEPPRRLTLVEERKPFDAGGGLVEDAPPVRMAMEFTLETHDGKTRLRIIHSGFGHDASWDDELESTSAGWQFELRALRHYLQRHKGRDRHAAWARMVTPLPPSAVWQRLLGPDGFVLQEGSLEAGSRFAMRAPGGERLTGTIEWHQPEWDLFGIVNELDAGVLRLSTWRGGGQTGGTVWLATYDPRLADRVKAIAAAAEQRMQQLIAV